jgi:hypothetical protein
MERAARRAADARARWHRVGCLGLLRALLLSGPRRPTLVATTTTYGPEFASSVARDNIFACQFHPEKSQRVGLRLLENFAAVVRGRPIG